MSYSSLWRAVHVDPEDRGAHAVLADALLNRADPRGMWMALEMRRDGNSCPDLDMRSRRFLFENRSVLQGPLADWPNPWRWSTRFGVVRKLSFWITPSDTADTAVLFAQLLRTGRLEGLTELRLLSSDPLDALVQWTCTHLPRLRSLRVGPLALSGAPLGTPLGDILQALPLLRSLRIPAVAEASGAAHATLERLEFVPGAGQIPLVLDGAFPRLRHVAIGPLATWSRGDLRVLRRLDLDSLRGPGDFCALWNGLGVEPVAAAMEVAGVDRRASQDPLLTPPEQTVWSSFQKDGEVTQLRRVGSSVEIRGPSGDLQREECCHPFEAADTYRGHVRGFRRGAWTEVWATPPSPC